MRTPFDGERRITSPYSPEHPAIDFAMAVGEEVKAVADGKIWWQGIDNYGSTTILTKDNSGYYVYGHVNWFTHSLRELFNEGDVLGYIAAEDGNPNWTGPHLHFQRFTAPPLKGGVPMELIVNPGKKGYHWSQEDVYRDIMRHFIGRDPDDGAIKTVLDNDVGLKEILENLDKDPNVYWYFVNKHKEALQRDLYPSP